MTKKPISIYNPVSYCEVISGRFWISIILDSCYLLKCWLYFVTLKSFKDLSLSNLSIQWKPGYSTGGEFFRWVSIEFLELFFTKIPTQLGHFFFLSVSFVQSCNNPKLNTPSTLNIDLMLWHAQLIVCAENVKSWFKSWVNSFTFQAYTRDIHIECSKQFKRKLYFYRSGQRGPFWAELKLL